MNNILWISIAILFIIVLFYIKISFHKGIAKSFKELLGLLIPIILSSIAIRIGNILLPDSYNINYYIAGIGTLIFSIILKPMLTKEHSDRYRKINKESKFVGSIICLLNLWLFLSITFFYIELFFPSMTRQFRDMIAYITLPVRFFWFFPNI